MNHFYDKITAENVGTTIPITTETSKYHIAVSQLSDKCFSGFRFSLLSKKSNPTLIVTLPFQGNRKCEKIISFYVDLRSRDYFRKLRKLFMFLSRPLDKRLTIFQIWHKWLSLFLHNQYDIFVCLRGYSTVFDILDRGSEQNETSYRNSEKPKRKIHPFASDQK